MRMSEDYKHPLHTHSVMVEPVKREMSVEKPERVYQGAEAIVEVYADWIIKHRPAKAYRHPALDERLRRERTLREERLQARAARLGMSPSIQRLDAYTLRIERIQGVSLMELPAEAWEDRLPGWLGSVLARLHEAGIVHGDVTPKNILFADDRFWLIDYGLALPSRRLEDQAYDLAMLTHTFSAYPPIPRAVLEAYLGELGVEERERFRERYEQILRRGRHKQKQ